MHINHIAIWTSDLERLKLFYQTFLNAACGLKYINPHRRFESYFLTFEQGARLELMTIPDLKDIGSDRSLLLGYSHLAFSVGSEKKVDELTERMRDVGVKIISEPRRTGDGYYESVVADPDGNSVELTV
ncbi:MAG: glyoxalase/bleomycin resistance/extradiol dioxygenase family protein [Chloroflexi bacterium HGW-Chloroflexi-10]|nr:MAG: glyoxalase/bleomycin resistance/extradiol dioxygenase family protein [Chloroflexi bacterium HGW-Chloroflexi-10]